MKTILLLLLAVGCLVVAIALHRMADPICDDPDPGKCRAHGGKPCPRDRGAVSR